MKLWCYDDSHHWGQMLVAAAAKRGIDARLFEDPREPEDGYVFMHMHHHPQVRLLHKRMMAILTMSPLLTLIPSYRASILFDDKLEQARQFAKWMPRTRVFYTPGASRRFMAMAKLPFMSKSLDGASSHNVRLIETPEAANTEIRQAFSDLGIKCRYGQTQRGYLLWQDFIPESAGDIRVIAIGTKRLILRRQNREGSATGSGASRITAIAHLSDAEALSALKAANAFFAEENIRWGAVDLIFDKAQSKWVLLEMTVSWTLHGYYECAFIDCAGTEPKLTERKGDAIWEVLLDEIEAGEFIDAP